MEQVRLLVFGARWQAARPDAGSAWTLTEITGDGKRALVQLVIPAHISAGEVATHIADLLHEATPARGDGRVLRLQDDDMAGTGSAHGGKIIGVLLAAGRGRRFDASGAQSKLLQTVPAGPHAGRTVAHAAALNLRDAVDEVIAVVRPDDSALAQQLADAGCTVVVNAHADAGMGSSIACAVQASADAAGWLIALADMPAVAAGTSAQVVTALRSGAVTAAPMHRGQRGHPVGFAARLRADLTALNADQGARLLLRSYPPLAIEVDDPGCLLDLDTPADFAALAATRG